MAKAIKHRRASESETETDSESVTETPNQGSLCGACETRSTESTCSRCGTQLVLDGHWVLEKKLGEGGQSRVYEARSLRDGARAAVKVMALDRARDWKNVEMFERSAKVLANLEHPGVPKFIASFRVEANAVLLFCLVHERIDGETLKAALNRGERYDEAKARRLLREVLGILQYLHGFSPPVIHRDIKQSNLMRRKGGGLVLIDFDLVSDEAKPDGGSTIGVGTSGYAPIEQLMGEAVPATDLYALGMTLVTLLSRKDPSALRERGEHRVDFERHVHVSKDFEELLGGMLEPEVARRFQTADAVLRRLEAKPSTSKPRSAQRDDAPAETESERSRIVPTAETKRSLADVNREVNRGIVFLVVVSVVGTGAQLLPQWLNDRMSGDPAERALANFSQVTWVGTVGTANAELTFAPASPSAVKATLVFMDRDEPTVEESLEGHMKGASAFELHGTAVKSLVGDGAPEPHIIDLGSVASGALAGYTHTATTKDYPLQAIFKPGTSVTKLPTIDVARATSRLLEVRWEGKLEGGKPLSLDTRREGAKLAGVLKHSENRAEGFIYVTRTGRFSFQSPASPGGGAMNTVSCQGSIDGAFDALKGECEFKASKGFLSESTTLAFSLRPTTSPAPAPTASASTTATANTHAPPPPAASTRKPR